MYGFLIIMNSIFQVLLLPGNYSFLPLPSFSPSLWQLHCKISKGTFPHMHKNLESLSHINNQQFTLNSKKKKIPKLITFPPHHFTQNTE